MVVFPAPEEDGGGYVAYAPDLPGCLSYGETAQEALADLPLAIGEWIDEAKRLEREVPLPGSLGERVQNDRTKLQALVERQYDVIRAQDDSLRDARAELERLREGVSSLMHVGYEPSESPSYLLHVWQDSPARGMLLKNRALTRLHN
jgi:predicted RNase H-like HicB family nuclease